jgi:DNA-binding GntR family transcriptional regulator
MSTVTPDPRPSSALLSDRVFEALKREIIECRLQPELLVAESSLAARYNVSKGPVREALKRLAQVGLVRSLPRVGYIVSTVNVGDFDEIFSMRIALEPLATKLAASRLTTEELDELEELALVPLGMASEPLAARGTILERANDDFHRKIAHASGNRRLHEAIATLLDEVERLVYLLAYDPAVGPLADQHKGLVDLLRTRDGEASATHMRAQLEDDYAAMRSLALSSDRARTLALQAVQ